MKVSDSVSEDVRSRWLLYLLAIAIALTAAAPLWGPGMVNTRGGGDSPFLLQRTTAVAESLRHGIFPIRWMAHAAYDLGYPFFNYYAALPYWLSGGLAALGMSSILAIQATQTFGFVLAALAMAAWAGQIYRSRPAVLLAVAAYTFAPFHMVNVYVRGDSLSEFYAFVWYPLILWALDRMNEAPTRRRIAVAALSYGALILTHNVSALIFSPFALLYALMGIAAAPEGGRGVRRWLPALQPFVWGFALTAWFWLPAIGETGYGQMGPTFTEGYFHYSRHFRGVNLLQIAPAFDYSVAVTTAEAGPFAVGLAQAALALTGGAVLAGVTLLNEHAERERSGLSHPHFLLSGLALAALMITPLSRPLWEYLPLLAITQFPWRFLSVLALFTAALTGVLADFGRPYLASMTALALGGLIAAAGLAALHPDRLPIAAQDVNRENLLLYETFTGNVGTTIRYEYLPGDVVPRPYVSEAVVTGELRPIAEVAAELAATLVERTPVRQVWRMRLERAAEVALPLHAWPGWQARVDGAPAEVRPAPGSGRLVVDVPAGEHRVVVRLRNTPLRTAAEGVSAAALLAGAILLAWPHRSRWRAAMVSEAHRWCEPAALVMGGFVLSLAAVFVFRAPLGAAAAEGYLFDFVQMPYPHHGPAIFDDAVVRPGPVASRAAPGDPVAVPLHVDLTGDGTPLTATLRLVSPAEPRHGVPYTLAAVSIPLAEGDNVAELVLPPDLSRGLYLVQLQLHGPGGERFARTPRGRGVGRLYVGAVRVAHGATLPPGSESVAHFTDLVLHAVDAEQPDPATLRLALAWSTPGTARNWSLSLRLVDAAGRRLVQQDAQPGYGYLPTSLWLPGEIVTDYAVLSLPEGLAPGDYTLQIVSYLQATMEGGGEVEIPIRLTEVVRRPPPPQVAALCGGAGVLLAGLELPEQIVEGQPLDFTAVWSARRAPEREVDARWALVAPDGGVVGASEGPLAPGSQTRAWPARAWVRAPVHVDLPPVLPEGPYRLDLILEARGRSLAECTVAAALKIDARPRRFTLPEPSRSQIVDFGSELRLLGYDLDHQKNELALTLWWQAREAPSRDYKRFVHFYDPASEGIAVQDDAMPRAWSYPTSWWMPGEVVSETVVLDLAGVPPGRYRLGVGWYDPESLERLPTAGTPFPGDRALLEDTLIIE